MRKEKFVKRGLALAMVSALVVSLYSMSGSVSRAADAIDVDADCELNIVVSESKSGYEDPNAQTGLKSLTINVDLYKVATVNESGEYKALVGFEGLELDKINDKTDAETWLNKANAAAQIIQKEKIARVTNGTITNGTGNIKPLETGMYLVVPNGGDEEFVFDEKHMYKYHFTPYLTALPGNLFYQTGNDAWDYKPTIGLKGERERMYADLTINKSIEGYSDLVGEGYFVFSVEGKYGEAPNEEIYSNVVSIRINGAEQLSETTLATNIPVGMTVTVTEIYSGASYEAKNGKITWTGEVKANELGENVATFTNEYNGKLIPGTGVLNQFTPEGDNNWNWTRNDEAYPMN